MQSKWKHLKNSAIELRKRGKSIKNIENKFGIARSTLSYWFKDIKLTTDQKRILHLRHLKSLTKARGLALIWHNREKEKRIKIAKVSAYKTLSNLKIKDKSILELALAMLYLGEGSKKTPTTSLGNSDPLILKFFIKMICYLYKLDKNKLKFDLHLRADQDQKKIQRYWSKELEISLKQFSTISIDKRTTGRLTYNDYKGVCVVNCGNVAIQRKLVYLGRAFSEKVIGARSSIG